MDNPTRALVTGGGGFLGKAIVKQLINRKYIVKSISRKFYKDLDSMPVEQIQGNISDKNAVEKACKDIDLVFHVAAKPGVWGDYEDYYQTNVIGTKNIIDACFKYKIPRLIYTSSPSVVFNGKDMEGKDESLPYPDKYHAPYPKTKAVAEKLVRKAALKGLNTIILRPHLIWGPEDNHLVPRIIERGPKLCRIGKKNKLVDTIYIDNAAHAHILAADKLLENQRLSGNIYFISQDKPIPLWDMVNLILKTKNIQPVTRSIPYKLAWLAGFVIEGIFKIYSIKKEPMLTRFVVDELATAHWFDISRAKKDLGYKPKVSTEQGLKNLEKWLNQSGNRS